jgi:hypothetical protein
MLPRLQASYLKAVCELQKLQLPRGARVLCFAVRDDEQQKACFALLKG